MNTQRKHRDIHGLLFKTAAILLMLVLVSTSLVTGRYARYTTSAESSDSARVAKFEVVEGETLSQLITFDIYPGETYALPFSVTNKSEVAVEYRIYAENETDNLPFVLTVGEKEVSKTVPFTGTLAPNGSSNTYTLSFRWPEASNSPSYAGKVDRLWLKVEAVQVD